MRTRSGTEYFCRDDCGVDRNCLHLPWVMESRGTPHESGFWLQQSLQFFLLPWPVVTTPHSYESKASHLLRAGRVTPSVCGTGADSFVWGRLYVVHAPNRALMHSWMWGILRFFLKIGLCCGKPHVSSVAGLSNLISQVCYVWCCLIIAVYLKHGTGKSMIPVLHKRACWFTQSMRPAQLNLACELGEKKLELWRVLNGIRSLPFHTMQ